MAFVLLPGLDEAEIATSAPLLIGDWVRVVVRLIVSSGVRKNMLGRWEMFMKIPYPTTIWRFIARNMISNWAIFQQTMIGYRKVFHSLFLGEPTSWGINQQWRFTEPIIVGIE